MADHTDGGGGDNCSIKSEFQHQARSQRQNGVAGVDRTPESWNCQVNKHGQLGRIASFRNRSIHGTSPD